jgi:hypothetical protein
MTGGLSINGLTRDARRVNTDSDSMSEAPHLPESERDLLRDVSSITSVLTRETRRGLPFSLVRLIQS